MTMKKRYHFLIAAAILLIGIIVGSIGELDLQINKAIFDRDNVFGIIVSSFGMMPGYAFLAFAGGVTLHTGIKKKEWNIWGRIALFAFSLAGYCLSVYALGKDVFSINGFYKLQNLYYLGFAIMAVLMAPMVFLGYLFDKKTHNPRAWLVAVIFAGVVFFAIVGGVSLLKIIFHRPRFRIVVHDGIIAFHNWWEPCFNYKDFINEAAGITSSEFKSFPSGHAGAGMITAIFLSFLTINDKRLSKLNPLPFYIGFTWCLVVMYVRMRVGAHYLTDVCFGALLTLIFLYIGNEFVLRFAVPKEETPQVEEKPSEEMKVE